jgi:hypothetical protein
LRRVTRPDPRRPPPVFLTFEIESRLMRGGRRAGAVAAYANGGATARANDRPAHDDVAAQRAVLGGDAHISLRANLLRRSENKDGPIVETARLVQTAPRLILHIACSGLPIVWVAHPACSAAPVACLQVGLVPDIAAQRRPRTQLARRREGRGHYRPTGRRSCPHVGSRKHKEPRAAQVAGHDQEPCGHLHR